MQSKIRPLFFKVFFFAFLCGIFFSSTFLHFLSARLTQIERRQVQRQSVSEIQAGLAAELPPSWIDPQTLDTESSKRKHQFWLYPTNQGPSGIGLKALEDPRLFQSIFPGYPDAMRADRALWGDYFAPGREFLLEFYSPLLQTNAIYKKLQLSTPGCSDIFRKYGADILIFGTSETQNSIILSDLHSDLVARGRSLRTLSCARGGTLQNTVIQPTDRLLRSITLQQQKPAKLAILGLSFWQLPLRAHKYEVAPRVYRVPFENVLTRIDKNYRPYLFWRLSEAFNPTDWENWMKLSFQSFRETPSLFSTLLHNQPLATAALPILVPASGSISQTGDTWFMNREDFKSEKSILQIMREAKPYYPPIEGAGHSSQVCDLELATGNLEMAIDRLLQVADRVLIYMTPVNDLQNHYAVPCYREGIARLLMAKVSSRVSVQTKTWTEYGLGWSDYLESFPWQTQYRSLVSIDTNHLNYEGARKFTQKIAPVVAAILGP